jgi:hypothetical protein
MEHWLFQPLEREQQVDLPDESHPEAGAQVVLAIELLS